MHLGSPYGRLLVVDFSRICSLGSLEIQEPQTKLWLFDTLVMPTLLYGVETWGYLVSIIAHMIRSKTSVHHDIILA